MQTLEHELDGAGDGRRRFVAGDEHLGECTESWYFGSQLYKLA